MQWKFHVGRDWSDTCLVNSSVFPEVSISTVHHIYVKFTSYEVGIANGYDLDCWYREEPNLEEVKPIFPGAIQFTSYINSSPVIIENQDAFVRPDCLKVFMEEIEITHLVKEIFFNIDADENVVDGWFTYVCHDPITNLVSVEEVRFV